MSRIARATRSGSALLLCGALMPAIALAEGAVRVLSCQITQQCDGAGVCEPHDEAIEFRMEPQAQHSDGSGEFTLRYRDQELPMAAQSEVGPFTWSQQQDRHTLLASSETRFLLHVLSLADEPKATIQFMNCSFRQ
jgi:hypothetical protein